MNDNQTILQFAKEIDAVRPKPDLKIEQYLMTPESMAKQVLAVEKIFCNKNIFFLGDDDHLSVLFAKFLEVVPILFEYDQRVIDSVKSQYDNNRIRNYVISRYDARSRIKSIVNSDSFYINPPYSSKNKAKAVKVWLSRVADVVPVGSVSVLVYPINEKLAWTLENLQIISQYAHKIGFSIVGIERDLHTYNYLPKDPGLFSSNIYLHKFKDVKISEMKDISGGKLYR